MKEECLLVHPAATLFPMMTDDELRELAEDIRVNGLRNPVVTHGGVVLDGRNRLKACEVAGIEPSFVDYTGDDPYAFVISANIHRRNLTQSQRAAIAAIARIPLMEEAKKRSGARTDLTSGSCDPEVGESEPTSGGFGRSREIAADKFGVSSAQIGRAWRVREEDPALFQKIVDGDVSVGAAHSQIAEKVTAATAPDIASHRSHMAVSVGADKWKEVTDPLRRYLSARKRKGMTFGNVNPKEAKNRIAVIDELIENLTAAREDLEPRSHKANPFSV